jgi:hypothetical protein
VKSFLKVSSTSFPLYLENEPLFCSGIEGNYLTRVRLICFFETCSCDGFVCLVSTLKSFFKETFLLNEFLTLANVVRLVRELLG